MQLSRNNYTFGATKFFRISLCHETLSSLMMTNFAMVQHHKYSLTELENMLPWEREIYVNLLLNHVKEEKQRLEAQQQQKG